MCRNCPPGFDGTRDGVRFGPRSNGRVPARSTPLDADEKFLMNASWSPHGEAEKYLSLIHI